MCEIRYTIEDQITRWSKSQPVTMLYIPADNPIKNCTCTWGLKVNTELEGCDDPITHQLEHGQVSFPPEVLVHGRAECREEVVEVHDSVYKGVEHWSEKCCMKKNLR